MNQLFQELINRKEYLQKIINQTEKDIKTFPEGMLRVSKIQGIPRYYHVKNSGDEKEKYISKKNVELAKKLAQKEYEKKLCRQAKEELDDINLFLAKHKEDKLEKIYSELNQYRKDLVQPKILTDEMYVNLWMSEEYETNPYFLEEKVYETKKNELVRTKSEMMLADMYYELGIPYRYEAELRLKNGKKKYPDFTLLDVKNRKVIYHEHLGLLDKEEYRQSNFNKIDDYRRSGIYMGKNLILTYEVEGCYLNMREIRQMMSELFSV